VLEDAARARHPVGFVGANQMPDNVGDSEGIFAFVAIGPAFGESAQERIESSGRALEKSDGLGKTVGHTQGMLQAFELMQKLTEKEKSGTGVPLRVQPCDVFRPA
jgi:hypothetical protein